MRGSKYIQSEMKDCYKQVAKKLQNGDIILFTGTICQIAGLKGYLNQTKTNINNLICCDIICHGVGSPVIWKEYLASMAFSKFPAAR